MPNNRGPVQTNTWPLVWADLDPANLPAWVVWDRTCQLQAENGEPCPRRVAGMHFGVRRCDHHWPADVAIQAGQIIG